MNLLPVLYAAVTVGAVVLVGVLVVVVVVAVVTVVVAVVVMREELKIARLKMIHLGHHYLTSIYHPGMIRLIREIII